MLDSRYALATLDECDEYEDPRTGATRYTHATGAWVALYRDTDCEHPINADCEVYIAFREGSRYRGTADDLPRTWEVEVEVSDAYGEPYIVDHVVDLDDDDVIAAYLRAERGATGVCVIDAGSHGEATVAVYVTFTDCDHPDDAARAWANEYQAWAEGDCWGIVASDGEACWGFIGYYCARAEAEDFLRAAIAATLAETAERAYWEARDVVTM